MFSGLFDLPWWGYIVVTLVLTHITIASVTIFLHRHQAHRALDLHAIPSHFFRFWLWLTTGMVTKEWAAIHRKHHAKCETEDDPHSPQIKGLKKVLWEGAELYRAESKNAETISRYGHGTPDDWIESHLYKHSVWGLSLMLIINVCAFGVIGLSIWAIQMLWIPFWAAGVINGVAHYMGYRNYDCEDASRNIMPLGILIGGEEMHNNHHTFATSAKFSVKWYEFDIGWLYIRILETLGLATVKKTIPKPQFGEARAADTQLLGAIVTHRYEVMRLYLLSLRSACSEELDHLTHNHNISFASMQRWMKNRTALMSKEKHHALESALAKSPRLQKLVDMRSELEGLWQRSSDNHEQLVQRLHDWLKNAEQSGIVQLQHFAQRLRCYAA